jgi:putative tryptophan/tyrosine transport system substrate-binding protein
MAIHIGRREFIATLGGATATWPLAALAQQPPRMRRVGYVGIQPRDAPLYMSFRGRMAELGYQEGRNFLFDYVQTTSIEGYAPAYRELAARKVDIFLAVGGEPALRAALAADADNWRGVILGSPVSRRNHFLKLLSMEPSRRLAGNTNPVI